MKQIAPLVLITALFSAPPLAAGDTLLLDAIAERAASLPHPGRGQTMEQVYDKFGPARQELPAVGEPPITRWVYEKFTVYFEHDRVIKTVIHR